MLTLNSIVFYHLRSFDAFENNRVDLEGNGYWLGLKEDILLDLRILH